MYGRTCSRKLQTEGESTEAKNLPRRRSSLSHLLASSPLYITCSLVRLFPVEIAEEGDRSWPVPAEGKDERLAEDRRERAPGSRCGAGEGREASFGGRTSARGTKEDQSNPHTAAQGSRAAPSQAPCPSPPTRPSSQERFLQEECLLLSPSPRILHDGSPAVPAVKTGGGGGRCPRATTRELVQRIGDDHRKPSAVVPFSRAATVSIHKLANFL